MSELASIGDLALAATFAMRTSYQRRTLTPIRVGAHTLSGNATQLRWRALSVEVRPAPCANADC